MAREIKRKSSFGTVAVDHLSPSVGESWPKALNVVLSFAETLKPHLGLGQILGRLNECNRWTKEGRRSAINLCVFTDVGQIMVNEGQTKDKE